MNDQYESFAAAVDAQTDERVNEILENARTLADDIIAAAKKQIEDEQARIAADTLGKSDEMVRRTISKAMLDAKKSVLKRRTELEDELHSQVRDMIISYTNTADYEKRLKTELSELKDTDGAVFIRSEDMPIAEAAGITARTDREIVLGGWYILYEDTGLIDDHTLDMKFAEIVEQR